MSRAPRAERPPAAQKPRRAERDTPVAALERSDARITVGTDWLAIDARNRAMPPGTRRAFDVGMNGERLHARTLHRTMEPASGAVGPAANERLALVFVALFSVLGGCAVSGPTRTFFADAATSPDGEAPSDECGCGAPPMCGQPCTAFCGCCGCSGTETVLVHKDGGVAAYRCRVSAGSPPGEFEGQCYEPVDLDASADAAPVADGD